MQSLRGGHGCCTQTADSLKVKWEAEFTGMSLFHLFIHILPFGVLKFAKNKKTKNKTDTDGLRLQAGD